MENRGRRFWTIGVILVLLGAGVGVGLLVLRGNRGHGPLASGIEAYGRGDWKGAADAAHARLKGSPGDREALRLLARASARRGRDEATEAIYRRLGASALEPEDLFLLGRGLLRRGQTGPALAALGAARDADPDHAETLDELSRHWTETGSLLEATAAAERLAKRPGWEVRGAVRLGRLRHDLLDPSGAARALADALGRDPRLTGAAMSPEEARRLLARCRLEAGQPAEARALLQGSAEASDPEGRWLLSRAFLQESKTSEAESALKSAGGYGRDTPLLHEPSPYVGSARCAECHKAEYQSEQSGHHARTLVKTSELGDLPWPPGTIADPADPRVHHTFHKAGQAVDVTTTVGDQPYHALVAYALGSNHQGQTFLAKDDRGQVRELRISRYPGAPHWDRTIEHPERPPDDLGYVGRPISSEATRACLHCHATNFRTVQEPAGRPEAGDRGIGCERCHGPGGNHLAAVAGSFSEPAIARPRLAQGPEIVALCAECHKAPGTSSPDSPGSIRFQAPSFVRSRCYTEGGGTFSCVTCHNPHRDAEAGPQSYEVQCLNCHPADAKASASAGKPARSSCPVDPKKGCLDCHMPRVTDAVPRSTFTDHHIRIRRDGPASTAAP